MIARVDLSYFLIHLILALFANVRVSDLVVTLIFSSTDVHPYIHACFWRRMRIVHAILYFHCLTVKSYVHSATLNGKKSFIFSPEFTLFFERKSFPLEIFHLRINKNLPSPLSPHVSNFLRTEKYNLCSRF